MKETIRLEFLDRPVEADINYVGGEYGAPRSYGRHFGLDFKAVKQEVHACESGRVVYSGMSLEANKGATTGIQSS